MVTQHLQDELPAAPRRALVRRPSPRMAEGLLTHLARTPVDLERAREQWDCYVDALGRAGWETVEVEPAGECPDSAFVEDTVVVYGDLAVICRPGAIERRLEPAGTEARLRALGYRIARIEAPGTLEGGDVLKHPATPGGTVWVGLGGRTNAEGIEQLRARLAQAGGVVVPVPVTKVLHLKSAVSALPDGTVLGYEPVVDDALVWDRFVPVPEEPGAHVVLLGPGADGREQVLMSSAAPATAAWLSTQGMVVTTVDISEFEKLEGCVTCLSVRLR